MGPRPEHEQSVSEVAAERQGARESALNMAYAETLSNEESWRAAEAEMLLAEGSSAKAVDGKSATDQEFWNRDRPRHQTVEIKAAVDADIHALIDSGIAERAQELRDIAREEGATGSFAKALRGFESLQDRYQAGEITSEQFMRAYPKAREAVFSAAPPAVQLTEAAYERIAQMSDEDRREFHKYRMHLTPIFDEGGPVDPTLRPLDRGLGRLAWSNENSPWDTVAAQADRVDRNALRALGLREKIFPSTLLKEVGLLNGRIDPEQRAGIRGLASAAFEKVRVGAPGLGVSDAANQELRQAHLDKIRDIRANGGSEKELAASATMVRLAESRLYATDVGTVQAEGVERSQSSHRLSGPDVISDGAHPQLSGDSPRVAIEKLLNSTSIDDRENGLALLRDALSEYVDLSGIAPLVLGEMSLGMTTKRMGERLEQCVNDPTKQELLKKYPDATGLVVALHRVRQAQHRMERDRKLWSNTSQPSAA